MKIDHDAAARGLTVVVAAAGILGSAIGLYSVYVGSGHPRSVGVAATVSTDGLALVAFFCAWRSTRTRYPLFVGATATALSMAAQYVYYSGGADMLSPEVKGAMSAWVPLSSILAAHLLLHAFGSADRMLAPADQGHTQTSAPPPPPPPLPDTPLTEVSTEAARTITLSGVHPGVHSPDRGASALGSALGTTPASALGTAPPGALGVHSDTALGVHSASALGGVAGSALGFAGTGRLPARSTVPSAPASAPGVHLPSALAPPAVTPPAPHSGVHSGPHPRVHSEVHSDRTRRVHSGRTRGRIPGAPPKPSNRTRERTDAELASALADAPGVHSVRAAAAHLKIGQERAKRVLALLETEHR